MARQDASAGGIGRQTLPGLRFWVTRLNAAAVSCPPTIEKDHAGHPERGREIARDYIAGMVHAQVDSGEADRQHQK